MGVILWIVFGALVGWIASLIMKTNPQQGIMLNVVVGIIGAVVGGWLMNVLGERGISGFNFYSFVVAFIGAIIFIAITKILRRI
ncbi:MAG: GlsB/YeaQ/YmgE family stress response membrane protein [Patescibacteria group bacterium]